MRFTSAGLFLGMSKFDLYWQLVAILVILNNLVSQELARHVHAGADVHATFGKKALTSLQRVTMPVHRRKGAI